MRLKFLITSLTSCTGCISALISLDIFPQFLERTKIEYFPFISDNLEIKECDVALVEGCVSEKNQIEYLQEIRKNAKKLYALGTCSAFGGILSLSNKKESYPISKFVEVDGIIPGCPPPSTLLGNCLLRLVENKKIKLSLKNMCSTCPLNNHAKLDLPLTIEKIVPRNDEIRFPEENLSCFLNDGILCLGPVTRDGCDHLCINQGLPCEGCLGPVSKGFTSNLINFLSLFNLSKDLRKYKGIYYRFSKSHVGGKD